MAGAEANLCCTERNVASTEGTLGQDERTDGFRGRSRQEVEPAKGQAPGKSIVAIDHHGID